MALTFAKLALVVAGLSPFTAFAADFAGFSSELCSTVASNGDENGTDSAEAYQSSCTDFVQQSGFTDAKDLVHTVCLKAPDFSADLHETADDSKTRSQLHQLSNQLISACFKAAQASSSKYGIEL